MAALGHGSVVVSAQTLDTDPETIISVGSYTVVPAETLPEGVLVERRDDTIVVSSKVSVRPLGPEKDKDRPRTESELVRRLIVSEMISEGRPLVFRPRVLPHPNSPQNTSRANWSIG